MVRLLKLLRQAEETRADEAKWAAMSQQERQEHESQAQFNGQNLTALVRSANSVISTLNFVTEEVRAGSGFCVCTGSWS